MDRASAPRLLLYPRWNEIFCSVPPGSNPFYLKLCMPCFVYSAHACTEHGVRTNCMSWDTQRCVQLKEILYAERTVYSDVAVVNCDGVKLTLC